MKKENEILNKYAKGNPFQVPEGYFENFSEELMKKLPSQDFSYLEEEKQINVWQRIRPWLYMAAMFGGLIVSIHLLLDSTGSSEKINSNKEQQLANENTNSDDYIDQLADFSMIDNEDTYYYLTDAE